MRNKRLTVAASSLLLVLLACAWIAPHYHPAAAQDAVLVKDISPGSDPASSFPSGLADYNGTLFFGASDAASGHELWKSNGTEEGTVLVKDIIAGAGGGSPSNMTNVDGTLFFTATTAAHGRELWKSNGTMEGTELVKDIRAGATGSNIGAIWGVLNGELYFGADDGVVGKELWKSNGTEEGTVLVKDINPAGGPSDPTNFAEVNGELFFSAQVANVGFELWKTNGDPDDPGGTVMVKEIRAGSAGSSPSNLTNLNGTLLFNATDGTSGGQSGVELWKSDGTTDGTVLVKDINVTEAGNGGTQSSGPSQFAVMNGTLFFSADPGTASGRELWKSNGTEAGTVLVKDIRPGVNGSGPLGLTVVNDTIFFSAISGVIGRELWKSDGTEEGTVLVKDINVGGEFDNSEPENLINVNGTLFFSAHDGGPLPRELWKSNGTEAGTVKVLPVDLDPDDGMASIGSTLYFSGVDADHGRELWKVEAPAPVPTTLTLAPQGATNPVGEEHCVTATVLDQDTNPLAGVNVAFRVSGATPTTEGGDVTDGSGEAQFCYTGNSVGFDNIEACVGVSPLDNTAWTACSGTDLYDTAGKTWEAVVLSADVSVQVLLSVAPQQQFIGDTIGYIARLHNDGPDPVIAELTVERPFPGQTAWGDTPPDAAINGVFFVERPLGVGETVDVPFGIAYNAFGVQPVMATAVGDFGDAVPGNNLHTFDQIVDLPLNAAGVIITGLDVHPDDTFDPSDVEGLAVVGLHIPANLVAGAPGDLFVPARLTPQGTLIPLPDDWTPAQSFIPEPDDWTPLNVFIPSPDSWLAGDVFIPQPDDWLAGDVFIPSPDAWPAGDVFIPLVGDWNPAGRLLFANADGVGTDLLVTNRADTTLLISDALAGGLTLLANGGAADAGTELCGGVFGAELGHGDNAVFTCGSLTAEVVSGPITLTLDDGTIVIVPTGTTVEITEDEGGGWDVTKTAGEGDPTIIPPPSQPDLEVTITAQPPDVVPAQTDSALTYEVMVRNLGNQGGFTGGVLTVRLPGGVNFESVTPNTETCSSKGRDVTCQIGEIAAAPGAGSEFTAQLVIGTKGGNTLTTEASVTANEAEPNLANNSASATVSVCRNCP